MCGLVASSTAIRRELPIDSMLSAIAHRGPDGRGSYVSPSGDCHLGHVRLAILDLSSSGRQPMTDESGRYVIVYNGEVYNYEELRLELTAAHGPIAWKTRTDTEVIVEGFARQGVEFLDRLNGIFALAIYDAVAHRLHVLRDPLGVKPLFITRQQGSVFFASELKGLLAYSDLKRTPRVASLADQLAFLYVPEPHTLFDEFESVEPGVCFTFGDGALVSSRRLFERLGKALQIGDEAEAVDRFDAAFMTAVRRQLVSDAPMSLCLSGGLDSSAIAFAASACGGTIRDAYTIAAAADDQRHDGQGDDLHYAQIMARAVGLELRIIPAHRDFLSLLPELAGFMEDGFSDPAAINTWLICRDARSAGIKVMLTGQGPDEFLGGYRRYAAASMLRTLPAAARVLLRALSAVLPQRMPGRFNASLRRMARLARLAQLPTRERVLGLCAWTDPSTISRLFRGRDVAIGQPLLEQFDALRDHELLEAMLAIDQRFDLRSLNLCYTDRMSMAAGVEARVPFLDFDLVQLMRSLPIGMKVRGRTGKWILKRVMERHLPNEIVHREKAGFGLPVRAWLQKESELTRRLLDPARLRRQGVLDPEVVRQILEQQFSGRRDHAYTVLALLCQQLWFDKHLK